MARKSRKQGVAKAVPAEPKARVWKCAVYARLSNKNNGRETEDSLTTQINFVRDCMEQRADVMVVGVFADNGRTGTTFEGRLEFDRLMDEVRAGSVDCIACKDLSRFGRNMYETGTYLERIFPFMGVRFIAVNDGVDTLRGDGGITVPFKGLVNELYAVETSRKVGAVRKRQMEEGQVTFGNACYGYRVIRGEHRLDVDDETAPFIPLIFDLYRKGTRLKDIAEAMEDMGAPTPADHLDSQCDGDCKSPWRDMPWTAVRVGKILDDPVYIGTLVLGKTHESLCEGIPWHETAEEERLMFPNAHPALITQEVWDEVHAERLRRKLWVRTRVEGLSAQRSVRPDELRGLFFCAECGHPMHMDRRFNPKSGEARGSVYKCRQHHGRGCGNDVRIPERVVRMAVMDAIRVQVSVGLRFEEVLPGLLNDEATLSKRAAMEARMRLIAAEAGRIVQERQRMYERYASGELELSAYKQMQKESDARARDCQERLQAAHDSLEELDALLSSDKGFDDAVAAVQSLDTFSRELVEALVSRIEVHRDGSLDVEFKFTDWMKRAEGLERILG